MENGTLKYYPEIPETKEERSQFKGCLFLKGGMLRAVSRSTFHKDHCFQVYIFIRLLNHGCFVIDNSFQLPQEIYICKLHLWGIWKDGQTLSTLKWHDFEMMRRKRKRFE